MYTHTCMYVHEYMRSIHMARFQQVLHLNEDIPTTTFGLRVEVGEPLGEMREAVNSEELFQKEFSLAVYKSPTAIHLIWKARKSQLKQSQTLSLSVNQGKWMFTSGSPTCSHQERKSARPSSQDCGYNLPGCHTLYPLGPLGWLTCCSDKTLQTAMPVARDEGWGGLLASGLEILWFNCAWFWGSISKFWQNDCGKLTAA